MALWDTVWPILAALIPSAGLLFLFFFILKRILEADRRERAAERKWDAERAALRDNAREHPVNQD
ncbi:lysyl-tRNA synthetase [Ornithinimicrobium faecis]|uniref:Lysyl-tRNA synthetase n=1 Tax=Ornithinimicrobium faecis TaxID=2934158 RepID=A0ABY4YSY2_9MICO|nr:lysyl-tRNA synthetase [Ornithinimicrobium sp. HY1793]USQ79590.1 lysyl-tRNA synthetase [Ornithinimicrobium sp. HY1793]